MSAMENPTRVILILSHVEAAEVGDDRVVVAAGDEDAVAAKKGMEWVSRALDIDMIS